MMQALMNSDELTERHLMNEAEMTLHHLRPGEFRRRVDCHPMETVGPRRVTEKRRVIGSWSLIRENVRNKVTAKNKSSFKQLH